MAQPFFHAGQHGLVVASFHIDHPVGPEPRLCDRWREEIGACDAPENLTAGSGRDAGAEKSGRCAIDGAVAATSDLMQSAESQAAARESRIDVSDAKRQHLLCARRSTFDPLDRRAQRLDGGPVPQ